MSSSSGLSPMRVTNSASEVSRVLDSVEPHALSVSSSLEDPVDPRSFSDSIVPKRKHLYAEEVRSQWNFEKIYKVLGTEEKCVEFSKRVGLIPTT
ncbi:unnamed protein product, partial [Brenthis ino]